MLSLVKQQSVILKYHNGPLLKGNITINLLWYGKFSSIQRSILVDFVLSLNAHKTPQHPSVDMQKTWIKTRVVLVENVGWGNYSKILEIFMAHGDPSLPAKMITWSKTTTKPTVKTILI
jgi:hypothetical protein